MWRCPKCEREFKRNQQSHYCGTAPTTIDEYIGRQSEIVQPILVKIRSTINNAIPDAEERISWSMPTWWKRHNIIQFAVNKHHIGLYAGEEAVEFFQEQLMEYETSKGTVRLPIDKPMPYVLISEIANWCYKQEIDAKRSLD